MEKNTTQKGHLRRTSILNMIGQVRNKKNVVDLKKEQIKVFGGKQAQEEKQVQRP